MQKMHCASGCGLYSQNGVIWELMSNCARENRSALKCAKGDQGQELKSSGDGKG
jgi:hypothetical protein